MIRVEDGLSLAHGIGGRQDLPIPALYAYAGAFAALFVSFLALGLLWPRSRFSGDTAGRPLPAAVERLADGPAVRHTLRALGLAAAVFVVAHLILGPDDPDRNPAAGAVFVLLWVGLVPASLLLGPVWRLLNPLRTVHALACRALRRSPRQGRPLPARLGYWPAALGLFAFTWLELAAPEPSARSSLLAFLTAYAVAQLAAAAVYGSAWFERGDAFEAYSALLGHLSPLGRRPADGRLVLRSPLNSLDAVPSAPGLAAAVCVLLGSTAYDGLSRSPGWIETLETSTLGRTGAGTLGLTAACLVVAGLYASCAGLSQVIAGRTSRAPGPVTAFAHSLLPIAVGYLVAHYFSLFTLEAPRIVAIALGADNPAAPALLLGASGTATLQVGAIVLGHVLGVVAAHDRSVRLFPAARAVPAQVPLLALMVVYTTGGLAILLRS
ncbi:hypothetical protein [Nocardioides speluncae]|uniref:hypothetical protein n=1 Tax=Nocardioides speluncae TaxID=2670337 RepID=UPI00197DDA90|nr:hypothetical protein [Nocardioides speluncae]